MKYDSSADNSIPSPTSQSSQLQKAAHISQAETSSVSLLSLSLSRVLHVVLAGIFTFCCCSYIAAVYYFFHMLSLSIVSFEVGIEKSSLCHCALPGCLDESLMQKLCSFSRVLSITACTNPLFLTEGQTNNLLQPSTSYCFEEQPKSKCYKMSTFRIYNGL